VLLTREGIEVVLEPQSRGKASHSVKIRFEDGTLNAGPIVAADENESAPQDASKRPMKRARAKLSLAPGVRVGVVARGARIDIDNRGRGQFGLERAADVRSATALRARNRSRIKRPQKFRRLRVKIILRAPMPETCNGEGKRN